MSIPREAQKQEKNSFKRSVKIQEKSPVLESLFGQISILQPSNSLRMESPEPESRVQSIQTAS